VFVLFEERDPSILNRVFRQFKNNILPDLLREDRIRTIEFTGDAISGPIQGACCILHIVGTLDDLREIVLDTLHLEMSKYDIEYGTRVIPIAESLSKDGYGALVETIIPDEYTREVIRDIIHYLKEYPDVFMIKRVPLDILNKIVNLYDNFKKWALNFPPKNKILLLHNIDEFIYGMVYVIAGSGEFDKETVNHYTERFIMDLSRRIEGIIHPILKKKIIEIGEEKALQLINSGCKDKDGKTLDYSLDQTTLGKVLRIINWWNKNAYSEHGFIRDEVFKEDCKKLAPLAEIRNKLSHYDKSKPEKGKDIFDNFIYAIDFSRVSILFPTQFQVYSPPFFCVKL